MPLERVSLLIGVLPAPYSSSTLKPKDEIKSDPVREVSMMSAQGLQVEVVPSSKLRTSCELAAGMEQKEALAV